MKSLFLFTFVTSLVLGLPVAAQDDSDKPIIQGRMLLIPIEALDPNGLIRNLEPLRCGEQSQSSEHPVLDPMWVVVPERDINNRPFDMGRLNARFEVNGAGYVRADDALRAQRPRTIRPVETSQTDTTATLTVNGRSLTIPTAITMRDDGHGTSVRLNFEGKVDFEYKGRVKGSIGPDGVEFKIPLN